MPDETGPSAKYDVLLESVVLVFPISQFSELVHKGRGM